MRELFNRKRNSFRALRLEDLETRQMLSVAPIDAGVASEIAAVVAQSEETDAAIDLADVLANSNDLSFTTQDKPGSYTVAWDAIDDAVAYHVQISRDGGETWINTGSSETTSYDAKGLSVGATTQFRVYGVNAAGRRMDSPLEGTFSRIDLSTSAKGYSVGDTIVVVLNGAEDATADVRWYRVSSDGDVEITDAAGSLSYTTTSDDLGYDLKVVATGTGISEGSNAEVAIVADNDLAFEYDYVAREAVISWTASENAVSYRVQLEKSSGDSTVWVNCATTSENSYTARQINPGYTYVFRVLALDSSNAVVDVFAGTLKASVPALDLSTSFDAYDTLNQSVAFSWNALDGAAKYSVQTLNSKGDWVKCATASVDSEGNVSGNRTTYDDGRLTYTFLGHGVGETVSYRVVAIAESGVALTLEESTYSSFGLELDHDAYYVDGDKLTATTAPETNATYQWYSSEDYGATWTAIADATTASYSISQTEAADLYWYKLVASEGSRSSVVYARPQSFGTTKPLDLVRATDEAGNLTLTFKAVARVATDSYQIEYYQKNRANAVWVNLAQVEFAANDDGTITATKIGGNYASYADEHFRVRAVSGSGWSSWNGVSPESPSLVVTTLDDVVDEYDYQISLREAIENYSTSGDTITFDASLAGQTITLGGSQLEISKNLTIDASALSSAITIAANSKSRIFATGGDGFEVVVNNVNLKGGYTSGNDAGEGGGAIYVGAKDSVTIKSSTISGNSAYNGGGAYVATGATLNLENVVASGNSAVGYSSGNGGAAVYLEAAAKLNATDSTFSSNYALKTGGAIAASDSGTETENANTRISLTNVAITANQAADGSAIYAPAGAVALYNALVADNSLRADSSVSAPTIISGGTTTLTNVTFDDADANSTGVRASGYLNVYNSILWKTSGTVVDAARTFVAYNSLAYGSDVVPTSGTVWTADDATNAPYDSNYRLVGGWTSSEGNSLIDAGSNGFNTTTTDLAGNPRVDNGTIDLGAYETISETASLVVTTLDDVVNPLDFKISLREAIDKYSTSGDTITFDASLAGQTITLGGSQLEISKNLTIDASSLSEAITISANSASRVFATGGDGFEVVVNNVNLKGGYTSGNDAGEGGGAIYVGAKDSVTIKSSTISGSSAYNGGGAYVATGATLALENVDATNNSAVGYSDENGGAGVYLEAGATLNANDSTFSDNYALKIGGAIAASNSGTFEETAATRITLTNVVLTRNNAANGSAFYAPSGAVNLYNTLIHDNSLHSDSSVSEPATIYTGGVALLTNVTFDGGSSDATGIHAASSLGLYNSIIWQTGGTGIDARGALIAYNSVAYGNTLSTEYGTLWTATDAENAPFDSNYQLKGVWTTDEGYSLIDGGAAGYNETTTDLAGNPRVINGAIDVGAYEAIVETPSLVVTTLDDVVNPIDNQISLREAIDKYSTSGDTITFDASLAGQTITLGGSQLEISKNLTIDASALSSAITIAANSKSRIFATGGDGFEVVVNNVNLKGGYTSGNDAGEGGGAIYVGAKDSVTIKSSTISANSAYNGGAAYVATGATLALENVDATNNSAVGYSDENGGAGVYLEAGATLNANDSTFSGNYAVKKGGAIASVANGTETENANTKITLTNVAISSNQASDGSAIYSSSGALALYNVLVNSNTSLQMLSESAESATIYSGGPATLTNVTFADPDSRATGIHADGYLYVYNSILWQTKGTIVDAARIFVVEASVAYGNTLSPSLGSFWTSDVAENAPFDSNYRLRTGWTSDEGNTLIDSGVNSYNPTTTDLAGNPRVVNDTIDIGAYEYQPESDAALDEVFADAFDELFED